MALPLPVSGLAIATPVPNDVALCGLSMYAQNICQDAAAPAGFAFSRGLRLTFGLGNN